MTDILRLERIDFDNTANIDQIGVTSLGLFIGDKSLTAYAKAEDWLNKQPPVKMYFGYNFDAYPKFRLIQENILEIIAL